MLYFFTEMYLIGHRRNLHSNQDTQASIESYHAALKRWMKIDNHQLRGRRMDSLVWRLTNPVQTHYQYNDGRKVNGFVLNKHFERIVANGIAKANAIPIQHVQRHPSIEGAWQVHSQSALGRWYGILDPYTKYTSCSCEWAIRGNMCKHQLAVIKSSTDISWDDMLEFLGTYYGSLRGGLEAMFEHNVPIDPFEDLDGDEDEEDVEDITNTNYNFVPQDFDGSSTSTHVDGLRQTQPSIEGSLQVLDKLVEESRELAIGRGLELVQHLQAMMTKVVTNVRRIRAQQDSEILHPQTVFEVVDDGMGSSIVRRKDYREIAMARMSTQKKRKRTAL